MQNDRKLKAKLDDSAEVPFGQRVRRFVQSDFLRQIPLAHPILLPHTPNPIPQTQKLKTRRMRSSINPRRGNNRKGMTLLEVLVAMAVFLLALAGIAQLIEFGSNNSLEAARTTTGTRLANSKMAEVEAGVIPVTESGSGTFDEEPLWQWSVEVGAPVALNTYPVTVRVWIESGRTVEVTTSQILYDPLFMGNGAAAVAPTTTTQGP